MKFRLAKLETTITEATGRHMAACYPDLPPLVWRLEYGVLTGQSETDDPVAVAAWAGALGLTVEHVGPGAHQVAGDLDGTRVVVWAVVDREVWEAGDRR